MTPEQQRLQDHWISRGATIAAIAVAGFTVVATVLARLFEPHLTGPTFTIGMLCAAVALACTIRIR